MTFPHRDARRRPQPRPGAARVHILRDVSLTIARGEAVGHRRSVRLRQVDAADDHGRARAARPRRGRDRRRKAGELERGRPRPIPRRARRHRLPVVSSDPHHDRARERRGAARARGRAGRIPRARATRGSVSARGWAITPRSFRAASSSVSRWPAPLPASLAADADEPTGNLDEATGRGDHGAPLRVFGAARRHARARHPRSCARRALRPDRADALRGDRDRAIRIGMNAQLPAPTTRRRRRSPASHCATCEADLRACAFSSSASRSGSRRSSGWKAWPGRSTTAWERRVGSFSAATPRFR